MQRKVIIVEDDPDIARLIQSHLADNNCDAVIAEDGETALKLFASEQYQLVILDLMLPDTDGLTLCRKMREYETYIPILMLTAKSSELDRVLGLEMGADDYLTKPFSVPELIARVKALFRRIDAMQQSSVHDNQAAVIRVKNMLIDHSRRMVTIDQNGIELTAREFDLLLYFAHHPGQVFNRVQLLDQVWGYNHDGYEHTVNSHINRLRSKIEKDPSNPQYILTVWGVGYKFTDGRT